MFTAQMKKAGCDTMKEIPPFGTAGVSEIEPGVVDFKGDGVWGATEAGRGSLRHGSCRRNCPQKATSPPEPG